MKKSIGWLENRGKKGKIKQNEKKKKLNLKWHGFVISVVDSFIII